MKKILFFVAAIALSFASCTNGQTDAEAVDSTAVDSVADTLVVDTAALDTVALDTVVAE